MKLCECGCGEATTISKYTDKRYGATRGVPVRFIIGHHARLQPTGKDSYRWNGGTTMNSGRVVLHKPGHPRSYDDGYVLRSVFIVEQVLGKSLPPNAVIHHFDENISNDEHGNLVVCENQGYHMTLHRRTRAYKACGNASWRKCPHCKKYDKPENLYIGPINAKQRTQPVYHRECKNEKMKEYRKRRKDERHSERQSRRNKNCKV